VTAEDLYFECWRAGLNVELDGDQVVVWPSSQIPDDLRDRLIENKDRLLRFLAPHAWVMTPSGLAKFVMSLEGGRCGVVLKSQPDRVTWLQKIDITLDCVESCECQQVGCPTEVGRSAAIETVKE